MTDPIQHLRELMAQYRAACDDADDHDSRVHLVIGRDMDRALRNLAPQLLGVVEAARIYRKTMDEYREAVDSKTPMRAIPFVAAVAEAEKELNEALAALEAFVRGRGKP